MVVGGLQKFSLLDYPGMIAAVVFTNGCNLRCGFCYNPMLVWPSKGGKFKYKQEDRLRIKEDDLFVFLNSRINKLDGVVITGGEPTIQADLPEFIKKIKDLGFSVKLDTNGTNPAMLKTLLSQNLIDYLAMDVKAPLAKYAPVAGCPVDVEKIKESVEIIKASSRPYEFRTTIVPIFWDDDDINEMGELLCGADLWYLQTFRAGQELVDPALAEVKGFNFKKMNQIAAVGSQYVKRCLAR